MDLRGFKEFVRTTGTDGGFDNFFESCRKNCSEIPSRSKCELVFLGIENAQLKAKILDDALQYADVTTAKDIKIALLTLRLSDLEAKNIADAIALNAQISDLNEQRTADVIMIEELKAEITVLTDQRAVDSIDRGLVALD